MRISDWSSDVFSSDLSRRMFEVGGEEVTITAMEYDLLTTFLANPNRVLSRAQLLLRTRNREWEPFDRSIDIRIEIGRASCRERVCQYVSISVVAASLKKTDETHIIKDDTEQKK